MTSPTVPPNAYTDAPEQHPNIILGSLQLLFWLFFRPSAWRNHLTRIDPALNPNRQQGTRLRWRNCALWRLLMQEYLILPFLAFSILGLILSALGESKEIIFWRVAWGVRWGLTSWVASGVQWGVASGVALAVTLGVGLAMAWGAALNLALGFAWGVGWGVGLGAASGAVLGVTLTPGFSAKRSVGWGVGLGVVFGVGLGVAFHMSSGVVSGLTSGLTLGVVLGVMSGVTLGVTLGVVSGVVPGVSPDVSWRVGWRLASIVTLGLAFGLSSGVASGVAFALGVSVNYWLPVVFYPLLTVWNILLYQLEKRLTGTKFSLLHRHSAFWYEWQFLPFPKLDKHLILILDRNPDEAKAAINYLITSRQRWAALAAQIEIDAWSLENCNDVRDISNAHQKLGACELESPAGVWLISFSQISQEVDAGLNQESAFNRLLALSAVAQNLDNFLRELTACGDKDALRFYPIALRWYDIVAGCVRELATEIEQETGSPQIAGAE